VQKWTTKVTVATAADRGNMIWDIVPPAI